MLPGVWLVGANRPFSRSVLYLCRTPGERSNWLRNEKQAQSVYGIERRFGLQVDGFASGADYAGKKTSMVLFINGRVVECSPLKRAIEAAYALILPKAAKPFIFLVGRGPRLAFPTRSW